MNDYVHISLLEETNNNSRREESIHTHTLAHGVLSYELTDSYIYVCARRRTRENTAQLYKRRVQPCRMKRMRMYREKRKKRKERVLIAARGRKYIREVRVSSATFVC
jgi:hypothetical protein